MLKPVYTHGEAAVYARQSRTDETAKDRQKKEQNVETTLQTQSAACVREANRRNFNVSPEAIFTERYTGAEMWDRPVLSELRRRIKSRDFRALIVYSTDRLARDPIHLALILEECQRVNCELVFVCDPLEDSPEGELILYIKGYASKIERLRIRDRMARGRNAITAAGKLTCQGHAPYGYKYDLANRIRVIDEETAPVVRDIFRWTIEGQSAHAITDRLRTNRIPCPAAHTGRRYKGSAPIWNNSAVSRILNDESYTGVTYVNKFGQLSTRDKKTGRHFSAIKDKKDWKRLPAGVTPPIISNTQWENAREAVRRNDRKSDNTRNSTRPVLLRGFVFCGQCSYALYPMSESTHKADIPNRAIYRCSQSRLKRSRLDDVRPQDLCNPKRLIAADLERAVWDKLVSFLLNPDVVSREVERVLSATPDTHLASDCEAAKKQVEKARRIRDAALTKYEDAIADDDSEMASRWDAKAKEANSDVKALTAMIKQLEGRLNAYTNTGKTAKAFAKKCAAVMGVGDFSFDEKRAALEALAVRVYALDGFPIRLVLNTAILSEQDQEQDQSVNIEVMV